MSAAKRWWTAPRFLALLSGVIILALTVGLRLFDIGTWSAPGFQSGDERLAASYDAYGWLAGARRVNHLSTQVMAHLLRFLQWMTGGEHLNNVAFWVPAVIAPLAALPIAFLAFWWALPEAAIVTGTVAGTALGYLLRTRLDSLDTDVFALTFPVILAVTILVWMEATLPCPWGRLKERQKGLPSPIGAVIALSIGLFVRGYLYCYRSGEPVALAILACGAVPALLLSGKGQRWETAIAFLTIYLVGTGGWGGIALSVVLTMVQWQVTPLFGFVKRYKVLSIVLGLALVGVSLWAAGKGPFVHLWAHAARYARLDKETSNLLSFPRLITTIEEATRPDAKLLFQLLGGHWTLFVLGTAGFVYLIVRRPLAFVFVPFLVLGVGSAGLGLRFTLYGAPAVGLGLGVGLTWALRDLRIPGLFRWLTQAAVLVFFLCLTAGVILGAPLQSIHSKMFAQSLLETKDRTEPDARFWAWWDLGYAVQYYSGRSTFADGYRNRGAEVIPLARVYATSSPQAAQRIMLFAAHGKTGDPSPFTVAFRTLSPVEAAHLFEKIENEPPPRTPPAFKTPDQYLVVSLENLAFLDVLSSIGTWDFARGASDPGRAYIVEGNIRGDGTILQGNRTILLASIDALTPEGTRHLEWPGRPTAFHALADTIDHKLLLLDDKIYGSLAVQMLIGDPRSFRPYFDLVDDHEPWVRIYRVNPEH